MPRYSQGWTGFWDLTFAGDLAPAYYGVGNQKLRSLAVGATVGDTRFLQELALLERSEMGGSRRLVSLVQLFLRAPDESARILRINWNPLPKAEQLIRLLGKLDAFFKDASLYISYVLPAVVGTEVLAEIPNNGSCGVVFGDADFAGLQGPQEWASKVEKHHLSGYAILDLPRLSVAEMVTLCECISPPRGICLLDSDTLNEERLEWYAQVSKGFPSIGVLASLGNGLTDMEVARKSRDLLTDLLRRLQRIE